MALFVQKLNITAECRAARLRLWHCPPFLFIVMGFVTIVSMVATYLLASGYTEEPEVAALVVIFVTVLFLVVGNLIISGFHRVSEANRMKSEFISIISHQLRSPLSIFKWTLDVLEREEGRPSRDRTVAANFLRTLRDATEVMIRLVNSLLEVSRIEARTIVLRRVPIALDELTRKIVADFQAYAAASNITLIHAIPPTLPPVVGDGERLSMVIQNLIDNAIRYTSRRGRVTVRLHAVANRFVRWSIQDEGVGIPKAEQSFIFQKFFRAENARNHETHGTGIGLYVAKSIVEALGGEIGFSSHEGEGSTFWFSLPIASAKGKEI